MVSGHFRGCFVVSLAEDSSGGKLSIGERKSMAVFPTSRNVVSDRGDAGRRLDLVLRRHLADMAAATRTQIQAWIENGQVSVNGSPVRRVATRARFGDRLSV